MEHGNINLHKLSLNKKEYEKLRRTITGKNKMNDFTGEQVNEVLRSEIAKKYEKASDVILIHDPSELRKKYTKTAEHIGKVKALDHKMINGYSSFNTIAIEYGKKDISLVQHELYSNKQPDYLSQKTMKTLNCDDVSKQQLPSSI